MWVFHQVHNLLFQIEAAAQPDNRIIAGYYAASENFRENTVEKCPGLRIAEKIVEYFPSAIFVVVRWFVMASLKTQSNVKFWSILLIWF